MRIPISVLVAALLLPVSAAAQSVSPSGQAMAQTCYVCHGPDGKSAGPVASLAGLPREHIVRQMTDFRMGRRPATVMDRIARSYSDDQIDAIAEFIASLK
jgi:sulfide dehydrogenase cytochrome subunit